MFFGSIVGSYNCIVISDYDGICMGESDSKVVLMLKEVLDMPNWLVETKKKKS
jgi:hypothetical protein